MKTAILLLLFCQPPHLVESFNTLNRGREQLGLPRYVWDDQLYHAAQEVVERNYWLYSHGYNIDQEGHWDLDSRIARSGWRSNYYPANARIKSSYTEISLGGVAGPNGWYYPNVTPEEGIKTLVDYLVQPLNGYEKHKLDYRAGYNRAAIGWKNGILTVVVGLAAPPPR